MYLLDTFCVQSINLTNRKKNFKSKYLTIVLRELEK